MPSHVPHVHDVVIVGGGASGLAAAYELRERDIVLLDAEQRLGGRLKSDTRGDYWLNYGGHLLPGPGSNMYDFVQQLGLEVIEIPGIKTAMAFGGKVYRYKRVETYPLGLPLTLKERISFAKAGLRLQAAVRRWQKIAARRPDESASQWRERVASFESGKTFRDLIGHLPQRVDNIFAAAARRASCEIEDQSAGIGAALFGAVWSGKKDGTALNLNGGSGQLGAAMERRLGDRARLGAQAQAIREIDGLGHVAYVQDGQEHEVRARRVIVALPSPTARALVDTVPESVQSALEVPRYGSWVGLTMLTDETGPADWDDLYALTAADMSFDMFFNHANPTRKPGRRDQGSSLMCYAGGEKAKRFWTMSDDEVREMYFADLYRLFPQLRGHVIESHVQRWTVGASYRSPGTGSFEPMIQYMAEPGHVIRFAGDYFAPLGQMESAVTSGRDAARVVEQDLTATVASRIG